MGPFEQSWVAETLGHPQKLSGTFSQIVTDSRKITPGCLFVAIKGDAFDGHDFALKALESGAAGILVEKSKKPNALPANAICFEVADSIEAYRSLAKSWRKQFSIPFICVAGSVGKTTTKELLTAVLRGKYNQVYSTQGSQNGFVGIPMTLLEVTSKTDIAVIEVGIDEIGAMEQHLKIVDPTTSLLTAIGPEHLEKLKDVPTVAHEESLAILLPAQKGSAVIVNTDDPWIAPLTDKLKFSQKALTCGFKKPASVLGEYRDSKLFVTLPNGSQFDVDCPLPGEHNARNLLIAIATAVSLGLNAFEIQKGLHTFKGAYGRSELSVFGKHTVIVRDYYNANPTSVVAGLSILSDEAKKHQSTQKHVALADMLELGVEEEKWHRSLAEPIIAQNIQGVFLLGKRMKWLQDELKQKGFKGFVFHGETHADLASKFLELFKPSHALLIKGSRSMKMEEFWKLISEKLPKA